MVVVICFCSCLAVPDGPSLMGLSQSSSNYFAPLRKLADKGQTFDVDLYDVFETGFFVKQRFD